MNKDSGDQNKDQVKPDESQPNSGDRETLVDLVDALDSVDTSSPEASLNPTSIGDNNGGRIELNEDPSDPNVIKK